MATLYHWDLPAALDDQRWLVESRYRATGLPSTRRSCFASSTIACAVGCTLNEPWVVTDGGYLHGVLAPGHRSAFEAPLASHNLMRAHGAAVQAYRARLNGRNQIGLVVNIEPKYAASQSADDLAAVKRAESYMNRQYLDPALLGSYPERARRRVRRGVARVSRGDFDLIRQKRRLHRRELLHASASRRTIQQRGLCARAASNRSSTRTPRRVGKCSRKV